MTFTLARRRSLALVLLAALLIVLLPAQRVVAQEVAPETKEATLEDLRPVVEPPAGGTPADDVDGPGGGVDDASEDAVGEVAPQAEVAGDQGTERSQVTEAPFAFSGLGFKGPDRVGQVAFRTLSLDGEWTSWATVEPLDEEDGPDPGTAEAAAAERDGWISDAIWVGDATHIQLAIEGGSLDDIEVHVVDTMGLSESLFGRVKRTLSGLTTEAPSAEAADRPRIITRAEWGADESWRKGSPSYATPKMAVLHHTATSNTYTQSEAAGQIRNMYNWHTNHNGWNDIGYNLIVDRFGNVYEGRFGGVDRGVIGAHASGWNTGTFGVAIMGNHETATPSTAAINAATATLAWKYDVHGIDADPTARVYHNNRWITTLVGHGDVGSTSCPGRYVRSRMDDIRQGIFVSIGTGDWVPVTGDWNADGRTTIGWFKDGEWRLRNYNSGGPTHVAFTYGTTGDKPVVGDWNGNGQTTIGVVRNGRWHLRNSNRGGASDIQFTYGQAPDHPLVGDWNGSGRDTIGIVRGGEWHLRNSLSGGAADRTFVYGQVRNGDIPLVGDWSGNGRDTIGIVRGGEWHLRNSLAGGVADVQFVYGQVRNGDIPVVGNWNARTGDTIGITRGATWYLRNSTSGGPADVTFTYL
jgi:hypothetical protein